MTNDKQIKHRLALLNDDDKRRTHIQKLAVEHPIVGHCMRLTESGRLDYEGALELAVCLLAETEQSYADLLSELAIHLSPSSEPPD